MPVERQAFTMARVAIVRPVTYRSTLSPLRKAKSENNLFDASNNRLNGSISFIVFPKIAPSVACGISCLPLQTATLIFLLMVISLMVIPPLSNYKPITDYWCFRSCSVVAFTGFCVVTTVTDSTTECTGFVFTFLFLFL